MCIYVGSEVDWSFVNRIFTDSHTAHNYAACLRTHLLNSNWDLRQAAYPCATLHCSSTSSHRCTAAYFIGRFSFSVVGCGFITSSTITSSCACVGPVKRSTLQVASAAAAVQLMHPCQQQITHHLLLL